MYYICVVPLRRSQQKTLQATTTKGTRNLTDCRKIENCVQCFLIIYNRPGQGHKTNKKNENRRPCKISRPQLPQGDWD